MAEGENRLDTCDISSLKETTISVSVDVALRDFLVVSYAYGVKIYTGVLLDSTKRNLPCGVPNINPYFNIPPKNPDDDTMHSVNQRFAYLDPNTPKKKMPNISKHKTGNMTVRLRPRQVLCSKCKGICNENSENVSRKRKSSEPALSPLPPSSKRSINAPITRSVNILNNVNNGGGRNSSKRTLRGKNSSTPLVPSEMKSGIDSNANKKPLGNLCEDKPDEIDKKRSTNQRYPKSCKICPTENVQLATAKLKRTLKKKRNVKAIKATGKDVNQKDDTKELQTQPPPAMNSLSTDVITTATATTTSATPSTRTIKISYGPQGEGTVLKIPAQIDSDIGNDSEENVDRAARRALKRAKKEAKRKVMHAGSPGYLSGNSPRYLGGGSPRHGISESNSPRYSVMSSCDLPKKRKHKKKKHKEDKGRKHKDGEQLNSCSTSDKPDDLSSSDEHGEVVPNFPPSPNQPLMMRVNSKTITSALGSDGGRLIVGDVVWGKILGFPWWPGRILTLTSYGSQGVQAHVAWYGSSTTSYLQCDQLSHYLDNFKARYKKKKKGAYKEAIKQATAEAKENAENRVRQPLGNSPSHNIIQVVPPALASPRQVDVVS